MLAVAGMAGAASFTHVHDWTMHNSPAGTGNWFGWANAMVSELIPLAAGLEARRRIRHYGSAGAYPIVLIVAAVALSLTGQFAEATHSISGWLISAVPALGFLALVKLVLSSPRPTTTTATPANEPAPIVVTPSAPERNATPTNAGNLLPGGPGGLPAHVVAAGRYAATNHRETTGRPITAAELAARISITPAIGGHVSSTLSPLRAMHRRGSTATSTSPVGGCVSIYLVAVQHVLHTCPAEPGPHPVDTRCTVLHVTPGRPCAAPVTIRCGDATAVVPCGRHNPADQQCGNCRTIITHPMSGSV